MRRASRQFPVLVPTGTRLQPLGDALPLEMWLALAGELGSDPLLVYGGGPSYLHKGIQVVGWRDLDTFRKVQGEAPV